MERERSKVVVVMGWVGKEKGRVVVVVVMG